MYPSTESILDGVITAVVHELQPELTSPWAQRQAASVLMCLEHVKRRILHERQAALEERVELVELLGLLRAAEVEWPESVPSATWDPVDALGAVVLETAELVQEVASLRGVLDAVIPKVPLGGTEWAAVREYLSHQADREDLFTALGIAWVGL